MEINEHRNACGLTGVCNYPGGWNVVIASAESVAFGIVGIIPYSYTNAVNALRSKESYETVYRVKCIAFIIVIDYTGIKF